MQFAPHVMKIVNIAMEELSEIAQSVQKMFQSICDETQTDCLMEIFVLARLDGLTRTLTTLIWKLSVNSVIVFVILALTRQFIARPVIKQHSEQKMESVFQIALLDIRLSILTTMDTVDKTLKRQKDQLSID